MRLVELTETRILVLFPVWLLGQQAVTELVILTNLGTVPGLGISKELASWSGLVTVDGVVILVEPPALSEPPVQEDRRVEHRRRCLAQALASAQCFLSMTYLQSHDCPATARHFRYDCVRIRTTITRRKPT